jgi:dCMP deaminase
MVNNGKINYYLDIAQEVMELGTCLHRNYGAIIVLHGQIVSMGYSHIVQQNGAHWGQVKNINLNSRIQEKLVVSKGDCYENCKVVHAESSAIAAAKELLPGAMLYLVGRDMQTG